MRQCDRTRTCVVSLALAASLGSAGCRPAATPEPGVSARPEGTSEVRSGGASESESLAVLMKDRRRLRHVIERGEVFLGMLATAEEVGLGSPSEVDPEGSDFIRELRRKRAVLTTATFEGSPEKCLREMAWRDVELGDWLHGRLPELERSMARYERAFRDAIGPS